jgi:hypothetical protein
MARTRGLRHPSTLACMKNAPSPQTDTQGRSGAANFAPITPVTPKPMGPKPIEPINESGRFGLQKLSSQSWCTPMSLTRIASSGSALSISRAARCENAHSLYRRPTSWRRCQHSRLHFGQWHLETRLNALEHKPAQSAARVDFRQSVVVEYRAACQEARCTAVVSGPGQLEGRSPPSGRAAAGADKSTPQRQK